MANFDPAAERATLDWLALIDAGDARGSWAAAATAFRAWCQSSDGPNRSRRLAVHSAKWSRGG